MHELVIKNGTLVDGTGAPRRRGDLAIDGGLISEIGELSDGGRREIDAGGLVVAPGFIDPHTHYDAQIWWDPLVTCSSWHGVTTVVMGNCGVGLAPCREVDRDAVARDLVTIESIPFDLLARGVPWGWSSFPEFMAAADAQGLGINVGCLAPLTPLRQFVMGPDASRRAATPEETRAVARLLHAAVDAGALGFSFTRLRHHFGHNAEPLGCRLASREELTAYSNVLRDLGAGAIELALSETGSLGEEELSLLELLAGESQRPVTWVFLLDRDDRPEAAAETLRATEHLTRCRPQVMPNPLAIEFTLHEPAISLGNMPSWKPVFGQSRAAQAAIYREPGFRRAFREELVAWGMRWPWERTEIDEASDASLRGQNVAEIAARRGRDVIDTFLDLALEDELRVRYRVPLFNLHEKRVASLVADPRTMIGLSDGGAHIDVFCTADYPTLLLGTWVRERQALTLERAVQRMTSEPAAFFGLADRGRLAAGLAADVVLFDETRVRALPRELVRDFPGNTGRLVARSEGVACTVVNGKILYRDGERIDPPAGRVLRSTRRSAR